MRMASPIFTIEKDLHNEKGEDWEVEKGEKIWDKMHFCAVEVAC